MGSIGFLHISDLHQGMEPLGWLWPNVREQLFLDLERLHKASGPWDVVLFTGDLTQRGSAAEFERLEQTLDALFAHLAVLGSHPVLLTVPGNHDLVRPKKSATLRAAQTWESDEKLRQSFWKGHHGTGKSKLVELVRTAFTPYQDWTTRARTRGNTATLASFRAGLLPGDFSTTLEKDGLRLGVLGLNSAFLQLTGNDYEGHLDIDVRQFQAACGGDGAAWAAQHDACFVLTHHPLSWLSPRSRKAFLGEIAIPGRFAAHLFGHMHEHALESLGQGGFEPRTSIQASSLFGLEYFGTSQQRSHGYSAGRIEIANSGGTLHLWPRVAIESAAGHRIIVPDSRYALKDERVSLQFKPRNQLSSAGKASVCISPDIQAAVAAYRQRLTAVCAQWRVAPSLAAVIGRSRRNIEVGFDQMYVPLRIGKRVEAREESGVPVSRFSEAEEKENSGARLGPDELLALASSLVIRGRAGSGKSTWVEASFRQLLRDDRSLPIRIPLRELARRWIGTDAGGIGRSLDQYIEGWLHEYVPELRAFTLQQLFDSAGTPRPVLFLDGWDETGPLGDEIRSKLLGFLRRYPRVLGVVTSRPYGECQPTHSDGFDVFELRALNQEEQVELSRRYWLYVDRCDSEEAERRAQQFAERLKSGSRLANLTDTPVFLLMTLLLGRSEARASSRWELHNACVEYLLNVQADRHGTWSEASSVEQWRPDNPEERLRAVAALAFKLKPFSKSPDLARAADMLPEGWPLERPAGMSVQRLRRGFISWLAGPAALLVERMDGRFEFVHLSIQDFLAAWHIGSADCSPEKRLACYLPQPRFNVDVLRWAARFGCRRDPACFDSIVRGLATWDDEAVGLLGSLFAEGVGQEEDFRAWSVRFVAALERRCNEPISECIVEWARDPDSGRRRYLLSLLQDRSAASPCQVYRRLNVAHFAWSRKHLPPPSQGTAIHLLSWFNSGECSTAAAVAVGRVLCGGSALWPGNPGDLALLNLWPSHRRVVGCRLQLAAFCGAGREDLVRCAQQWLPAPKWNTATSKLAEHFAGGSSYWRNVSDADLDALLRDLSRPEGGTAQEAQQNEIDLVKQQQDGAGQEPCFQHVAERWALASADDLRRLCGYEPAPEPELDPHDRDRLQASPEFLALPPPMQELALRWSAIDLEQWTSFWVTGWLSYADQLRQDSRQSGASDEKAQKLAGFLGKLWLINWTRYWGIVESRFAPIRSMSWDSLAIPLAEGWARALVELLHLSPDCPWINDFVWLDLMSIGRDTARAVLAKEQPEDALWTLFAEASRLSIGATTDSSKFDALLGSAALPDEPLWPALARHLVGRASLEDQALLDDLARHPERRIGSLSWGLQYIVRGDILLNDGSVVTLDELAAEAKQPTLPYVDAAGRPKLGG